MTKRTRPRRVKAVKDSVVTKWGEPPQRYWLIPRTAEAYDAMVRQWTISAVHTYATKLALVLPFDVAEAMAIAALRSIGITRPKD